MKKLTVEELNLIASEMGSRCEGCKKIESCYEGKSFELIKQGMETMTFYEEEGTEPVDELVDENYFDPECDCDSCIEQILAQPLSGSTLVELWLEEAAFVIDRWAISMSENEASLGWFASPQEIRNYKEEIALYNEIARLRQFELDHK